jgi:hypothetical protein
LQISKKLVVKGSGVVAALVVGDVENAKDFELQAEWKDAEDVSKC